MLDLGDPQCSCSVKFKINHQRRWSRWRVQYCNDCVPHIPPPSCHSWSGFLVSWCWMSVVSAAWILPHPEHWAHMRRFLPSLLWLLYAPSPPFLSPALCCFLLPLCLLSLWLCWYGGKSWAVCVCVLCSLIEATVKTSFQMWREKNNPGIQVSAISKENIWKLSYLPIASPAARFLSHFMNILTFRALWIILIKNSFDSWRCKLHAWDGNRQTPLQNGNDWKLRGNVLLMLLQMSPKVVWSLLTSTNSSSMS